MAKSNQTADQPPSAPPAVFALCGVSKRRGFGCDAVDVLADVELDLDPRARMIGVAGPSGSGKTTLLELLAGFDVPDRGAVVVAGATLPRDPRQLRTHRRRVGCVLQAKNLIEHATALDNVAFPLRLRGATRSSAHQRARHWLEVLGLSDCARRKPARLSGGQQQRVAIARALAMDASLLLADEPTSALDGASAKLVLDALRRAVGEFGVAVVMVSHDQHALAACDLVLRCEQRSLRVDTPPTLGTTPATASAERWPAVDRPASGVAKASDAVPAYGALPTQRDVYPRRAQGAVRARDRRLTEVAGSGWSTSDAPVTSTPEVGGRDPCACDCDAPAAASSPEASPSVATRPHRHDRLHSNPPSDPSAPFHDRPTL